ncbi:radical SAM domain iron-sulfur cluster-binding oxidoreductase [Geotalea daltonii FRC-32]|uniref:Radical SAM domain iron-sulfur cluster-binding oxidoreductase n=1 Tax=Geotalea daltonii (strain DSM 22248 / JCM 15807 / FRC-32) TaxID=316067 RepID=B9LZY7_GEODF|nr:radical SAM protein [Geotalea daltonii]ACM20767.1 radical SAM domain iron-sulfur cluster-binding oxidoreductase [Geotalea daltonii FRC-32]
MEYIRACCFWPNEDVIKVNWEITGKCQLSCKHCLNKHRRENAQITLKEAEGLIDDLAVHGIKRIILTGGEPLLFDGIFQVVNYAQAKGMTVSINTNGLLLDKHFLDLLCCESVKIRIGLCGFSAQTHDEFTGRVGAFDQVINNILELLPYKAKISLQYTVTKKNIHELPELFKFLKTHDLSAKLNDIIEVDDNAELSEYVVSQEEISQIVNSDVLQDKKYIDLIRPKKGKLQKCPAGKNIIGILSDGKITPCSWISSFTSEYDSDSVKDVFGFPTELEKLFNHPLCSNCGVPGCGKGCVAVALKHQPSIDPLCPVL